MLVNLLAAAALGCIAVVALVYGRSTLFPPVVFGAVWCVALVVIAISGDTFYPISDQTRFVFVSGALVFAIGAVVSEVILGRTPRLGATTTQLPAGRAERLIDAVILIMVVMLPIYWAEVKEAARATAIQNILLAARVQGLRAAQGLAPDLPFVIRNLVQLSIVFTLVAFNEARPTARWRIRLGLIFLLSLAYQILTGGRAGALALIVGVAGLAWIKSGKLRVRSLALAGGAFLAAFAIIAIQLEKGTARRDLALIENVPAVVHGLQTYGVGALVAFDRVVESPDAVPSTGGISRTAKEIANRFGADYEIPSLHAQYTTIGDFIDTNVYTLYFSYFPDLGLMGTWFILGMLGVVTSAVFRIAHRGAPWARVIYGIFFVGLCQSVFNESFFTNINLLFKAAVILLVVYGVLASPKPTAVQAENA